MRAFITLVALCCAVAASATTFNSDGTAQSIQTLHDQARNGDIITIPQGNFTWDRTITISKAITLRGRGSGIQLRHDANQPVAWQGLPYGYLHPCDGPIALTTDTTAGNHSTSITDGAGTDTLLVFTNPSATLSGVRITSNQSNGYVIRDGTLIMRDCWFRRIP